MLSTTIDSQGINVTLSHFVNEINDDILPYLLQGRLQEIPKWEVLDPSKLYFKRTLIASDALKNIIKKVPCTTRDELALCKHQSDTPRNVVNKSMSKVFFISDAPMAGKSTIITILCPELKEEDVWIVRVNLNERTDVITKWAKQKTNIKNSNSVELLTELVSFDPALTSLLRNVMRDEDSPVKIILLLDALDDVNSLHDELVITFIKQLESLEKIKKIIVTTRPHLEEKLKSCFGPEIYSFYPFTDAEQMYVISKLMAHSSSDVVPDVDILLQRFKLWIAPSVRGTPMMLQLLAKELKKVDEISVRDLSVHTVLWNHIELKIREHVLVKEGVKEGSNAEAYKRATYLSRYYDLYYYYAVKQILQLTDEQLRKDFGLKGPSDEHEKNAILSHGLIAGTQFLFEHKSSGECFFAKWLMTTDCRERYPKNMAQLFLKIMTSNEHENTRMIMDVEAKNRTITKDEAKFFTNLAHQLKSIGNPANDVFNLVHPNLTQHVFDGLNKFCKKEKLQKLLLAPSRITLLHHSRTVSDLEKVLVMYENSGILESHMPKVLTSTHAGYNILHLLNNKMNRKLQSRIFGLLMEYCEEEIKELLLGELVEVDC